MRKLVLLFYTVLTTCILLAQNTTTKKENNAELLWNRQNSLIQREIIEVDTVKNITVDVVKYTDLMEASKASAVRVKKNELQEGKTLINHIDPDEVDLLLQAVAQMKAKMNSNNNKNALYIRYECRSGFAVGATTIGPTKNVVYLIELTNDDNKVSKFFFSAADFDRLIALLNKAKLKL